MLWLSNFYVLCRCKGSTTLSVIGKEAIYIAADERVVSPLKQNVVQKESVVGGDYIKIRKLSDQIVLTTAGNTELCDKIILNAKNLIKLTRGSDSMKFLRLKEQLRKFRRKWKKDHLGQIFLEEFMLCGKYEGKRTIFVIRHHATEKVQGLNNSAATGIGQKYATHHLDLNVKPHFIACNYVQCLRQAIAVSSLKDFYTGGRVRTGALGMGGFVRDRKVPHVLDNLFTHYDEVHYKLKGILFCMTESWKYNVECEALVEAYVRSLFGKVVVHVIAVHRRSSGVIRVIRFQDEKAASCGFKQVAGKHDCAKITVELDDARKFTVALFKPTKEIIGFFCSKFVQFDY